MSSSLVARTLRESKLQPHRTRYYLTSTDPDYDAKVRDIVSLYLQPPAGATVLSLDEKPNIQALERVHPSLRSDRIIPRRENSSTSATV